MAKLTIKYEIEYENGVVDEERGELISFEWRNDFVRDFKSQAKTTLELLKETVEEQNRESSFKFTDRYICPIEKCDHLKADVSKLQKHLIYYHDWEVSEARKITHDDLKRSQ